jgi:ABC-type uncharacterized transport system permease subunit
VIEAAGSFLDAPVRTATPHALAALGETVVERAGMINIGLEGIIIAGAFAGAAAAAGVRGFPARSPRPHVPASCARPFSVPWPLPCGPTRS